MKSSQNLSGVLAMWSWNKKLSTSSTHEKAQKIMHSGFDGFCIDPRFGLKNKYLGDEWMRNISELATTQENKKLWICDDNRMFSGTSNGFLNSSSLSSQQKFLCFEPGEKTNDRTVIFKDGYHFYYDANPYYIDIFDPSVAKEFIENSYLPYQKRFSSGIEAFLCRAPHMFTDSVPWSFTLPAQYKNTYGEELLDVLLELFRPVGNYINTRIKFYTLVAKLFCDNFLCPIYKICEENNIDFAVLFPPEESSYLPTALQYEYSSIPTTQHFSRNDSSAFDALLASSVSDMLGKSGSASVILSEAGYSATIEDYKRISQQQLVRGITNLILSAHSSSLKGNRKYENTSPLLFQEKDEQDFSILTTFLSKTSNILAEGEADFDTLLIYGATLTGEDASSSKALTEAISTLEKKHIPFHIADELFLGKYAHTEGACIVVGKKRYNTLVILPDTSFLESTTVLLSDFEIGGGFITTAQSIPSNEVCDNEKLLYTYRSFEGYKAHYFVNNSPEEFTAAISVADKMVDFNSGGFLPFYGIYKFSPYESILVIDDGSPQQSRPFKKALKTLDLTGEWTLSSDEVNNLLLLDTCDVYFDDVLTFECANANDVVELATALLRPVKIDCRYKADIRVVPKELYLACENPDIFTITINGTVIDKNFDEDLLGKTLSLIDISSYVTEGENVISLSASYSPSGEFLLSHEKALESPFEIPKLNYPLDISPIFLAGDFSVGYDGDFKNLDKNASRYVGRFYIGEKKEQFSLSNLEKQGFPFFFGELSFSKVFNLSDTSYCIKFIPRGINSITIEVNGKKLSPLLWQPFEQNISDYLIKGDNEIKITMRSTLRNTLGPHHIPLGELLHVRSGDFFRVPSVWNLGSETFWDNNYCLIEFGFDNYADTH